MFVHIMSRNGSSKNYFASFRIIKKKSLKSCTIVHEFCEKNIKTLKWILLIFNTQLYSIEDVYS